MTGGLAKEMTKPTGHKMEGKAKAAAIVAILFAAREYAHRAHLKTSSYSHHIALNEFYDADEEEDLDVTDLADALAEVAQGKWGKLDIPYVKPEQDLGNPANVLETYLHNILAEAHGCDNRALSAVVDQIEELFLGTLYKLKELR